MNTFLSQVIDPSKVKNIPQVPATSQQISHGLTILYEIIGAIGVMLIIVAALRYIVAAGDANKISESKRMIAYTLVGMVVVAMAATLIQFVVNAKS